MPAVLPMMAMMMMMPLLLSLPQAEVMSFASRVAQALGARPGTRVLVRAQEPGRPPAASDTGQLGDAIREALRQKGLEPIGAGETAFEVYYRVNPRRGRPLAVARVLVDGREPVVLFNEFAASTVAEPSRPARSVITVRHRTLLTLDLPVLDIAADSAADSDGNLFLLHPDRLRAYDLNSPGVPLKAEVGLDAGADGQRDPLVRLLLRESPRQLELYSAGSIPPAPPMPIEGYELRSSGAPATLRVPHPSRAAGAALQIVPGRNYFRSSGGDVYGIAPVSHAVSQAVSQAGRAHWVVLDTAGRLRLAGADLRPLATPGATAPGEFGSSLTTANLGANLACAGPLVLATGPDPDPARDRIAVLRIENDRLLAETTLELDGAVRALKTLPSGFRILAVVQDGEVGSGVRIEEIELRCQ